MNMKMNQPKLNVVPQPPKMDFLTVSSDPRLYFGIIPTLLAASAGMTWEEYVKFQNEHKGNDVIMQFMLKAGLNTELGGKKLAFAIVETVLNSLILSNATPLAIEHNSRFILDTAKTIFEHRIPLVLDQLKREQDGEIIT